MAQEAAAAEAHRRVPRLLIQLAPPGSGGVRDFVHCLEQEWTKLGVASVSMTLSKREAQAASLHDRVAALRHDTTQSCSLVLHFSGYGYGERGVCLWLLDELQALRAAMPGQLRLIVVFHELFASGPPWRSAFWLAGVQRSIATRLAQMADELWTNTAQHAGWLRTVRGAPDPVHLRPVFCNVSEPDSTAVASTRRPTAVIFGSAATRQRVCGALGGHAGELQRQGVTAVVEVGPGPASSLAPMGLPHHYLGRLEPDALSALLQTSRFGLLDYPAELLGKSGVFAAYAAHGCVVLNTGSSEPESDGLKAGETHLCLPDLQHKSPFIVSAGWQDQVGQQLARWYAPHRLSEQARALLALAA